MKALSDFLAIFLFLMTYILTKDMVIATAVAVVIGIVQAIYTWIQFKKLSTMQWVSLITVVVFGGATIFLKNSAFIMLKTTVICWISSAVILITHLMGKNGLKLLLSQEFQLPESVWTKLTYAWVIYFFLMGLVNLIIAYPFTPEREAVWINYKFYAYLPMTILFSLGQGIYIVKNLNNLPDNLNNQNNQ